MTNQTARQAHRVTLLACCYKQQTPHHKAYTSFSRAYLSWHEHDQDHRCDHTHTHDDASLSVRGGIWNGMMPAGRPAACRSITSRGRAGQSRPYPAVINTGMFLLPVRLGLHLWPFFNVVFEENNLQVLWDSAAMRADLICLWWHTGGRHHLPASPCRRQGQAGRVVRVPGSPANWWPRRRRRKAQSKSGRAHARTHGCCCWLLLCCSCETPFVNYDGQVGALKLERSRVPLLCVLVQWCYKAWNASCQDLSLRWCPNQQAFQFLMMKRAARSAQVNLRRGVFFFWIWRQGNLWTLKGKGVLAVWLSGGCLAFQSEAGNRWISRYYSPRSSRHLRKVQKGGEWLAPWHMTWQDYQSSSTLQISFTLGSAFLMLSHEQRKGKEKRNGRPASSTTYTWLRARMQMCGCWVRWGRPCFFPTGWERRA